ncbi:membrane-spanning 4-domains subfamily A member 15-like [Ptychodera flava]|uniref:membrane-spanning 4-domains subfamily A member 15-like n=1 Tax=Ptychodera flava TaxID=63121 RepID=UPI00396A4928
MENTDLKGGSLGLQQPTTATAAPQQIVIIQQASGNTSPNLAVGSFRGLGIGQLVCGIVLILVAIIQITVALGHDAPMDTFWNVVVCAIFFIITGSLGISAARTKNRCLIYATLVLSILSLLGGISLLPGTIIALVYAVNEWPAWISVCVITLFVAVTEMILAIIQMVDCCRAVCCGSQQQPHQAVYYYPQPYTQNQPMVLTEQPYMANQPMAPTGQVAYAPNQPVAATGQYYPQYPSVAPGGEKG